MITCVLPVRNEEHNLPYVLETVRWCAETIVVDMASEDRSVAVAESFGCRVLHVPLDPQFNNSRLTGLEAADTDWVITLDADEMMPRTLAERLQSWIEEESCDAIFGPRLNFKMGRQMRGGLWPDLQRRVYRKQAVEFVPAIHDYLVVRSPRVRYLDTDPAFALWHLNYQPVVQQIAKLNQYTTSDTLSSDAFDDISTWYPLRYFLSLYVKYHGFLDGWPGAWWCVHQSFYMLVQRHKKQVMRRGGSVAAVDAELEQCNAHARDRADRRLSSGDRFRSARMAHLLSLWPATLSRDRDDAWPRARAHFFDLATEVMVWEAETGGARAQRAQSAARQQILDAWNRS